MTANKASLYKKIINVMEQVKGVPKNGYNSFHKYKFVQESDLTEYVRKFMVEQGLVLFNSVKDFEIRGDIAIVTYDFTMCDTETGETITTSVVAEGQDKGDKKFYKALTGATKYYLMKIFLVPSGIDPEMDATTDQQVYGNPNKKWDNAGGNKQKDNKQNSEQSGKQAKATDKQVELMEIRIGEFMEMVDQDRESVVNKLKERIGDFDEIGQMTAYQAVKSIEMLKKWKAGYENRT